jgi:hypothetical protein
MDGLRRTKEAGVSREGKVVREGCSSDVRILTSGCVVEDWGGGWWEMGDGGDGCRTALVRTERESVCALKIFVKRHRHDASCRGDGKCGGWDSLKS